MTLELWDEAVWWVGVAARKQLLQPATVLGSGCLQLLLTQGVSCGSPAHQQIKNQMDIKFPGHITSQFSRVGNDYCPGWFDKHIERFFLLTKTPLCPNVFPSEVWECCSTENAAIGSHIEHLELQSKHIDTEKKLTAQTV